MAKLEQLHESWIRTAGDGQQEKHVPGSMVSHVHEPSTLGTVVAVNGQKVSVLWSKPPLGIDIQTREIKSPSRQLNVRWEPGMSRQDIQRLDDCIKSELRHGQITPNDVVQGDPDVIDIKMTHTRGLGIDFEIKRRSLEPRPMMPDPGRVSPYHDNWLDPYFRRRYGDY